jgi:hypothetical protein
MLQVVCAPGTSQYAPPVAVARYLLIVPPGVVGADHVAWISRRPAVAVTFSGDPRGAAKAGAGVTTTVAKDSRAAAAVTVHLEILGRRGPSACTADTPACGWFTPHTR